MSDPGARADRLSGFVLVSRADCHLCEAMHAELTAFLGEAAAQIPVLDVDDDAELRRRYGYKVPVLLHAGEIVCFGRFDRSEVERALKAVAR